MESKFWVLTWGCQFAHTSLVCQRWAPNTRKHIFFGTAAHLTRCPS